MFYNISSVPGTVIDRYRTGNYGENNYSSCNKTCCDYCSYPINDEEVFDFDDELLCEDCYRERLFETYSEEHRTTLEEYNGNY